MDVHDNHITRKFVAILHSKDSLGIPPRSANETVLRMAHAVPDTGGYIRVILGLYWGYIRVILGLYRDYIGIMERKWKLLS